MGHKGEITYILEFSMMSFICFKNETSTRILARGQVFSDARPTLLEGNMRSVKTGIRAHGQVHTKLAMLDKVNYDVSIARGGRNVHYAEAVAPTRAGHDIDWLACAQVRVVLMIV